MQVSSDEGEGRRMAESLSFQEMTTRLIVRENIINNQHRERFKSYIKLSVFDKT